MQRDADRLRSTASADNGEALRKLDELTRGVDDLPDRRLGLPGLGERVVQPRDVDAGLVGRVVTQGVAAEQLTLIISTLNDALLQQIIDIEKKRFPIGEIRWCWLAFGSEGRYEQTISTDQDNGLIFEAGASEPDAVLRLRSAVRPVGPLQVDTDLSTGQVTVTSSAPGTYELSYSAVTGGGVSPGRVRVDVVAGEVVEQGQVLVVLEAMKMEHPVRAGVAGTVTEVLVTAGDQVEDGAVLAVVLAPLSPGEKPSTSGRSS